MTHASTVLILGARGRFGQAAARAFARAGWQVLGQVRPGAQGTLEVKGCLSFSCRTRVWPAAR